MSKAGTSAAGGQQGASGLVSALRAAQSTDVTPLLAPMRSLLTSLQSFHGLLQAVLYASHAHQRAAGARSAGSGVPPLPPYEDLLARFSSILGHLVALGRQLTDARGMNDDDDDTESGLGLSSSDEDDDDKDEHGRKRDRRKEKWLNALVVPAKEIDEAREWLVGMLLRTKETPEVEAEQARLLAKAPALPLSESTARRKTREALAVYASRSATMMSEECDGILFDWKARVPAPASTNGAANAEEEREGAAMEVDESPESMSRPWTLKEVATYERTGRRPAI